MEKKSKCTYMTYKCEYKPCDFRYTYTSEELSMDRSDEEDAVDFHNLRTHRRKIVMKRDKYFCCKYCKLYALERNKIASHMRGVHQKKPKKKRFRSINVDTVLRRGDKLYHCKYCDLFALDKDELATHVYAIHKKKPPKSTRPRIITKRVGGRRIYKSKDDEGDASEDSMDYDLSGNERECPCRWFCEHW